MIRTMSYGSGSETGGYYEPSMQELLAIYLERRRFEEAARCAEPGMGISGEFDAEDIALLVAHLPDALDVVPDVDEGGWLVVGREAA
jgi:hypothetical protein